MRLPLAAAVIMLGLPLIVSAQGVSSMRSGLGAVPATMAFDPNLSATVELPGDWISGTPLWLKVTIKNDTDAGVEFLARDIDNNYPFVMRGFQFRFLDLKTGQVIGDVNVAAADSAQRPGLTPPPRLTVSAHGILTSFFRVASPKDVPATGEYKFELILGRKERPAEPHILTSTKITIRQPTEQEQPYVKTPGKLWKYPIDFQAEPLAKDAPTALKESLAMDGLLHAVFVEGSRFHPDPVANAGLDIDEWTRLAVRHFDPAVFDAAAPQVSIFFSPVLGALRYEILTYHGDAAEALALKQRTLKETPGLAWMFERVDKEWNHAVIFMGVNALR